MRLIDADAIKEELYDDFYTYEASQLEDYLKRFPTIEAEPVRHGRWEWGLNSMNQYGAWCSECKCGWEDKGDDFDRIQGLVIAHKYCPNCGATMDGGSDE